MPKAGKITKKLYETAIKLDLCDDYVKVCRYSDKLFKLKDRALRTLHKEFSSPPKIPWLCLYSALNTYGVPVAEIDFSRPQQVELRKPDDTPIDVDDDFALVEANQHPVFQSVTVVPKCEVPDFFVPAENDVLGEELLPLANPRSYFKDQTKKRRPPRLSLRQLAIAEKDANNQVLALRAVDPLYTDSETSGESELSF